LAAAPAIAQTAPAAAPTVMDLHGHLFGDLKQCKRIVFIIDASGSMLNRLADVTHEVEAAVDGLNSAASLNIITFSDNAKLMSPNFVCADRAGKRQAREFLEGAAAEGLTIPMPAFHAAVDMGPDRICFVTDADIANDIEFAKDACRFLQGRPVQVDCVAWLDPIFEPTPIISLRLIAHRQHGVFRCVVPKSDSSGNLRLTEVPEQGLPHAEPGAIPNGDGVQRVELGGVGSPATAVAFVCDLSVSPKLRRLMIEEMARAVGKLDTAERFNIIFYGPQAPPQEFSPTLVLAQPANRTRALEWSRTILAPVATMPGALVPIDAQPVVEAVKLAFRHHAEAVYLLFGEAADLGQLHVQLHELNKGKVRKVQVHPIAIVPTRPNERSTVTESLDDLIFSFPVALADQSTSIPQSIAMENDGCLGFLAPDDQPTSHPASGPSIPTTRPAAPDFRSSVSGDHQSELR